MSPWWHDDYENGSHEMMATHLVNINEKLRQSYSTKNDAKANFSLVLLPSSQRLIRRERITACIPGIPVPGFPGKSGKNHFPFPGKFFLNFPGNLGMKYTVKVQKLKWICHAFMQGNVSKKVSKLTFNFKYRFLIRLLSRSSILWSMIWSKDWLD